MENNGYCDPIRKCTDTASLLISYSMSTVFDNKIAVRKNTQIAQFSIVTQEQSKFIKPVDAAILTKLPGGDPDLTKHLNEILRTDEPDR